MEKIRTRYSSGTQRKGVLGLESYNLLLSVQNASPQCGLAFCILFFLGWMFISFPRPLKQVFEILPT